MKKIKYFIPLLALIILWGLYKAPAIAGYQQQESPEAQTKIIVAAANDFLNTLSINQRKQYNLNFYIRRLLQQLIST